MNAATPHIIMTPTMTEVNADIGFESGTYTETLTYAKGKFDVHGSYLMVFQRTGGRWLIVQHMWTEDLPKPT